MHRQEQMNGFKAHSGSALRESQGRYRTLFDLAPIAVYSCDGSINRPCVSVSKTPSSHVRTKPSLTSHESANTSQS
jgi:hypothetical protein